MRVARWIFLIAGIYGVLALAPGFFAERMVAAPALTHPEFYYGFLGSALVWQFVFLMIARDPVTLRPLMAIAVLEKAAFFAPALWLYFTGRLPVGGPLIGGVIDGVWMALFLIAWRSSRDAAVEAQ
jgi:hypothetical protein